MKRISTVGPKCGEGGAIGYLRPDQFPDHLTVIKIDLFCFCDLLHIHSKGHRHNSLWWCFEKYVLIGIPFLNLKYWVSTSPWKSLLSLIGLGLSLYYIFIIINVLSLLLLLLIIGWGGWYWWHAHIKYYLPRTPLPRTYVIHIREIFFTVLLRWRPR